MSETLMPTMGLSWSARARRRTVMAVDVIARGSGIEHRIARTANSRRVFEFDACEVATAEAEALAGLFDASGGALRSFRFRDALDFKSCSVSQAISALDQRLGVGDGAQKRFPLTKTIGEGVGLSTRRVFKPIVESVQLAVQGAPAATNTYQVLVDGVVEFNAAPAAGAIITAGFLFDTCVRLEGDAPSFQPINERICAVGGFQLSEVVFA